MKHTACAFIVINLLVMSCFGVFCSPTMDTIRITGLCSTIAYIRTVNSYIEVEAHMSKITLVCEVLCSIRKAKNYPGQD